MSMHQLKLYHYIHPRTFHSLDVYVIVSAFKQLSVKCAQPLKDCHTYLKNDSVFVFLREARELYSLFKLN